MFIRGEWRKECPVVSEDTTARDPLVFNSREQPLQQDSRFAMDPDSWYGRILRIICPWIFTRTQKSKDFWTGLGNKFVKVEQTNRKFVQQTNDLFKKSYGTHPHLLNGAPTLFCTIFSWYVRVIRHRIMHIECILYNLPFFETFLLTYLSSSSSGNLGDFFDICLYW